MQHHLDHQVSSGVGPEELDVQHVRQPGQRMPIGFILLRKTEGPTESFDSEPIKNTRVFRDIRAIVIDDEVMLPPFVTNDTLLYRRDDQSGEWPD